MPRPAIGTWYRDWWKAVPRSWCSIPPLQTRRRTISCCWAGMATRSRPSATSVMRAMRSRPPIISSEPSAERRDASGAAWVLVVSIGRVAIDFLAANHSRERLELGDLLDRHVQEIPSQDCEVGKLAGLDRAAMVLLADQHREVDGHESEQLLARGDLLVIAIDAIGDRVAAGEMIEFPEWIEGNHRRVGAAGDQEPCIEIGLHRRHLAGKVPAPIFLEDRRRDIEMILSGDHQLQVLHPLHEVGPRDEGVLDRPAL